MWEVTMEKREDRRNRTEWHGKRARCVHLRKMHRDGTEMDAALSSPFIWRGCSDPEAPDGCVRSIWYFAKSSLGCRCKRRPIGRPKVVQSSCHESLGGYHPSVRQRIEGKRLCHAWLVDAEADLYPHPRSW